MRRAGLASLQATARPGSPHELDEGVIDFPTLRERVEVRFNGRRDRFSLRTPKGRGQDVDQVLGRFRQAADRGRLSWKVL